MPRQTLDDDETPRRRRGAKAVAIAAEEERGQVLRLLLHSPKDTLAGLVAVAAVSAIVATLTTRATTSSTSSRSHWPSDSFVSRSLSRMVWCAIASAKFRPQ